MSSHQSGLLVYFICHSISSKKNLVIKLNGDDTKNNIALSINILMTVISQSIWLKGKRLPLDQSVVGSIPVSGNKLHA